MTAAERIAALQQAFWLAGERLMYHHTNPWELDEALTGWGYALGACEAQDLIGLDKVLARQPDRPVPILGRMVAEGRLGKIGGVGYYRYPGGGGAVSDPLIEDLILEEAWFGKVTRSDCRDDDLVAEMNAAIAPLCKRFLSEGMGEAALQVLLHRAVHFPMDRSFPSGGV